MATITTAIDASVTPPSSTSTTAITTTTTTSVTSDSAMPGVPTHLNFKNRLQEFSQRASIPFPSYETVNVSGSSHPPQFSSSVTVDGETYTSLSTFSSKKAAEQDAAKVALEGIDKKIKYCISNKTTISGFPPIFQDKVFCKSILHEFSAKMNKELPKYETVRVEGIVPVFSTSVFFNGVKYVGGPGVNKKEAEQLAARNAILSILVDPEIGMVLSEIIKSKAKLLSTFHENNNTNDVLGVPSMESHTVPRHEFRMPGEGTLSPEVPLPIAFVPELGEQTPLNPCGQKRKNKKKKKANKKAKIESEAQMSESLPSHGMS